MTSLPYSPMVAGLVVTHMRPFQSAEGLDPLPEKKFTEPPVGDLKGRHNKLEEARHKLCPQRSSRRANICDHRRKHFV